MSLTSFDFRAKFPPEIKEGIFKYLLFVPDRDQALEEYHEQTCLILSALRAGCPSPDGYSDEYKAALKDRNEGYKEIRFAKRKIPELLMALRCAPDLYSPALKIFYTINTFEVNPQVWVSKNLGLLALHRHLSQATLRTIKKLNIMTDFFDKHGMMWNGDGLFEPHWRSEGLKYFNLGCTIPQMSNLQILRFKVGGFVSNSDCMNFINIVQKLEKLTRVEIETTSSCRCIEPDYHIDFTDTLVEGVSEIWGIQAKLLQVYEVAGVFFWQAPPRATLNWSSESCTRNLRPKIAMLKSILGADCDTWDQVDRSSAWDENGRKWDCGGKRDRMSIHPVWAEAAPSE